MITAISKTKTISSQSESLRMSYEEFLDWDYEGGFTEWVDGEVIIHMSTKFEHQSLVDFLNRLLGLFVQLFSLGQLCSGPYTMRAMSEGNAREPDLFFVAQEHAERITSKQLVGPADLVIEVISDDSVTRDRENKFKEYAQAGVPEYWIIDPRPGKQRADFYYRDEATGQYVLFATEDDERVESRVLSGFWLQPAWLWEIDRRDPFTTFCEMAGLPSAMVDQFRQQIEQGFKGTADKPTEA